MAETPDGRCAVSSSGDRTARVRNTPLLGPYSRTTPRVLWWS